MAAGQPTKYKPEYCKIALDMSEKGASMVMIAARLKVHIDTMHEWKTKHPEFSEAMKQVKVQAEAYIENMVFENMFSKDFNTTAAIFMLKARHGWRDRDKSDNINVTISHESLLKALE